MGPWPTDNCSPKGLTNNWKKKVLARLSDCQMLYSNTEAKSCNVGQPINQSSGMRQGDPPGICYFTECPTMWLCHSEEAKPLISSLPESSAKKEQGDRPKSAFLLMYYKMWEHGWRNRSIAVERHVLSDFLMDEEEAGLLFLKKEN